MVYEGIRDGFNFVIGKLMANITLLMGIVMILYGALGLYWDYFFDENMLFSVAVYASPLVMGVAVLLDKHRSIFFAVGMYAVALGISRLLSHLPQIFSFEMMEEVMGLVMGYMAGNLVYTGIRYMMSNSRRIFWIVIGSGMFAALNAIDILMYVLTETNLNNFIDDEGDTLVTLLMVLLYIVLVLSKPVQESTDLARLSRAFAGHRLTTVSGPDISVDPESVTFILHFCDGTLPESEMTGFREGPVHQEYTFLFHDGIRYGTAFLRRWYGPDGPVYMTFAEHSEGSVFGSNTMRVIDIMMSGNRLIVGFEGAKTGVFRIRSREEENGPQFYRGRPKGAVR